jgi:DNA-binding response OmpR family regulator
MEATRGLRHTGFAADELPIIAVTANAYAQDIAMCRKAGMQGHLVKPVRTKDVVAELSRVVGSDSGVQAAWGSSHQLRWISADCPRLHCAPGPVLRQFRHSILTSYG